VAISEPQMPAEVRALDEGTVDYRTLVEQIPAITYTEVHDARQPGGQRTTYVSPQASRILGHAPAEFLADPELWRRLRHPADRAMVMASERVAEVTKRPFHAEYRMFDRGGNLHWFRDEAVILERDGGTFWQGVMFDITAEKQAGQQAQRAELRYRSLVETLPCVVYIDELDERATNVYTSPQTEALFGYTQQDWADDPDLWLGRMVHPDDVERIRAAELRHAEANDPFDEVYRVVHRDGRIVWVRDVGVVIADEEGTASYSQGFMFDITAQKEAEADLEDALARERAQAEQLRALDDLKNTLLHTLSHDLKGPLTAVLGAAAALRRPDLSEAEQRELLDGMTTRAQRMDRLLSDLLDLERLGRGILEPTRYPVDVGQLVTSLVHETDALEDREFDVLARPVIALVDAPKVERMVENLLVNAARHTPPGTRVWVRVLPQDGGALICVEDDGPGVPEELKEAVFEPFRKGDPEAKGSGIGLSLVSRFAEMHGGRAWVQDRPGGGASFRIFVPGPTAAAGPSV
jgi:PAS domain S-box-containing protein